MSVHKEDASKPDELQSGLSKTESNWTNTIFGNLLILMTKKEAAMEKNFGMRSKCEDSLFEYPAAETYFDAHASVSTNTFMDMSSILARPEPPNKYFNIDEAPTGEKNQISSDMVTSHVCKVREDILSMAEHHPQSSLPEINKDTLEENHVLADPIVCARRSSDVTHDKEANTVQLSTTPDGQQTPYNTSDSIGSNTCLTPEKQLRSLKREYTDKPLEAALGNRNKIGIMYNSLETYLSVFTQNADSSTPGLHFPASYKKTRREKVHSTVTSRSTPKPGAHQTVEGNLVETEKFGVGDVDAQVRVPTNTITDRSSIPASHLLDLNAPPKMILDAVLRRRTSQVPPSNR